MTSVGKGVDECLFKGFHPTPYHRPLQIHSSTHVILLPMENLVWKVMAIELDLLMEHNLKLAVRGKKMWEKGGVTLPWPSTNELVHQGLGSLEKVVDDGWVNSLHATHFGGEKSNIKRESFVDDDDDEGTTIVEERLVKLHLFLAFFCHNLHYH